MRKNRKTTKKGLVKQILLFGLFVFAGIVLVCVGLNLYVCLSAGAYIKDASEMTEKVDAIIVPGAGLKNGEPGTVLTDRLDTAIKLYQDGVSDRILMSGDHGDDTHNEVRAMKDYAIEKGVPAGHIFMDHAGFTTYETVVRARDVFQIHSCVITTQKYHLFRAVFLARGVGLKAYGVTSNLHLNAWKYLPLEVREFFARLKAVWTTITKPEPTYVGDPIPITGDGSVTDD